MVPGGGTGWDRDESGEERVCCVLCRGVHMCVCVCCCRTQYE